MYLYLDTSHFLAIGLLSSELKWEYFEKREQLQHSADIHALIHDILSKKGIETLDLKGLIVCNGPGSYTGIRLGEGIAQLFELSNIPVFAFHQYEVPQILGVNSGKWVCHAFKKEIFCYKWNDKENSNYLMKADDWINDGEKVYGHQPQGPWESALMIYTTDLIQSEPKTIFSYVISNKMRRDPYYFRPLDQEFKRSVV